LCGNIVFHENGFDFRIKADGEEQRAEQLMHPVKEILKQNIILITI
jgi:hypothetical protein